MCLSLFLYKVIVHWKLKLLNFLVDAVFMARIFESFCQYHFVNNGDYPETNNEQSLMWHSVQVLLLKNSNIKNGKDIIKMGVL